MKLRLYVICILECGIFVVVAVFVVVVDVVFCFGVVKIELNCVF